MTSNSNLNWFFSALGYTLAAAGAALLLWALFWDRSRGRRRCPKCWYDMTGTPGLTCPECGRGARSERRFFKARRRWRFALVAVLALAGAHLLGSVPAIRARGWWAAAPRVALLASLPIVERAGPIDMRRRSANPLYKELTSRFPGAAFGVPDLYFWERWLSRPLCRRVLTHDASDELRMLAAMFYTSAGGGTGGFDDPARAYLILARTARTYASCRTCKITGDCGGKPCFIAFERATGNFRFEYFDNSFAGRWVTWRNAGGLHTWWHLRPTVTSPTSLSREMGGAYGVSGRSSGTLPALVVRDRSAVGVTDMLGARVTGVETVDGHECWCVEGRWWNGGRRSLRIDRATHVLRRAADDLGTERYTTELDIPLNPDWFTFDPDHQERSPLR